MIGITFVLKREDKFCNFVTEFEDYDEYSSFMPIKAVYNLFKQLEAEVDPTYEEASGIAKDFSKFSVYTTDEFTKGEVGEDYFNFEEFKETTIEKVILWNCYSIPKWSNNPEDLVQNEEVIYRRKNK